MSVSEENAKAGAKHILTKAGYARNYESILLVVDSNTRDLAVYFEMAANELGLALVTENMPVGKNHGEEPDLGIAMRMKTSSLVLALTTFSLAHSNARKSASASGARFLSLPQYSLSLLEHSMIRVDYRALAPRVKAVSEAFTGGSHVHISSASGTDLTVDISGRAGNYCPAFVESAGQLGSPPDIEANISPLETSANGIAVVDGSITHPSIGLLTTKVEIEFHEGIAVKICSDDQALDRILSELFQKQSWKRRVLAEVGIGLNPEAELTGAMLSDEGTLGTAHLGLGSNFYVGGENLIDFHLDFVIRDASVNVDDLQIMKSGTFMLDY